MNRAFPDANVEDYASLISNLKIPDPNDRHVLAAAIYSQANVIVTSNLKDFPSSYLRQFNLDAIHPDAFINNLINLNPEEALKAFLQQVSFLRNPPMSVEKVIAALARSGLINTSLKLKNLTITL